MVFKKAKKGITPSFGADGAVGADGDAKALTSQFPLFFKRPVPIDGGRHKKAGIAPTQDFFFAKDSNSIVINAVEFIEAAKFYPIVFTQSARPLPLVIVGLESTNYFVDENGKWKEDTYIPAYVRKYPFVFMDASKSKQLLLCVDEDAPQYRPTGGKDALPLFDGDKPSPLSLNALEFCTAFHNHHLMTRGLGEALQSLQLLAPAKSTSTLHSGRIVNLADFQMIDEKQLAALPDEKILELHKKGWLPLIYFALMSASHWNKITYMADKKEPGKRL